MVANVVLPPRGICSRCFGKIEDRGKDGPPQGSACTACQHAGLAKEPLFKAENVEVVAEQTLRFDPLFRSYGNTYEFHGSKVMINGREGTLTSTQGDMGWVAFQEKEILGKAFFGLSHGDMIRIYEEAGNSTEPPPLQFEEYRPEKVELLDEPILEVLIENDKNGRPSVVCVFDKSSSKYARVKLPVAHLLHSFANMFMRFRYGCGPNFCFEGGFTGSDWEIKNNGEDDTINIYVDSSFSRELNRVQSSEDMFSLMVADALQDRVVEKEQARRDVLVQNITSSTAIQIWAWLMKTMLKYNWHDFAYESVQEKVAAFNRMQDILLNILSPVVLSGALEYAAKHPIHHYGSRF